MLELLFLVLQVEYYPYFVDFVSDKGTEYCKVTFIINFTIDVKCVIWYSIDRYFFTESPLYYLIEKQ